MVEPITIASAGNSNKILRNFYEYYIKLVGERKIEFDNIRDAIEKVVEEMVAEGLVGKNVRIISRIKAPESALIKMKQVMRMQKEGKQMDDTTGGTYDIYGITISCDTTEELEKIKVALKEKGLKVEGESKRNKKTGYKAEHFRFAIEKFEKLKVECHLQTFENQQSKYPHLYYKYLQEKGKSSDEKLTPEEEEEAKKEVQRQYSCGELKGIRLSNGKSSRVPQIWEAQIDSNGKMVRREFSEDEALRLAYYPALEGIKLIEKDGCEK